MTETESKALQAREKAEMTTPAEQTRPGLVFTPPVDIFETEKEITVLADMPGVKAGDLNIDLDKNVLTLDGDVISPRGADEADVIIEYRTGKYYRQFTLSQVIDQAKIDAEMKDGVLRLRLPKVEAATPLIKEFDSYGNERFNVDILSLISIAERGEYLSRFNLNLRNIELEHIHGDYTAPDDLAKVNPGSYDNIVLVYNSWLTSDEESDARTILGYLLLRQMLPKDAERPKILMELLDPENEKLFQQRTGEVLISPLIISHIVAHVAMRRDLNVVFEELFTVGGAEIYFRAPVEYDIEDREIPFAEIEKAVFLHGDIALGVCRRDTKNGLVRKMTLNPPKDSVCDLGDSDQLVVLTTYI